jgi:hypothetical protein
MHDADMLGYAGGQTSFILAIPITLVTDHGNQEGVDHFVKMICWLSIDKNGNHTLLHFNLDSDKGGHTTVVAANAIATSLQSLGLDDSNTKYSYICGESDGGASVQSLCPRLVEIDFMAEGRGFMNCLLHALNLAYEKGSKEL